MDKDNDRMEDAQRLEERILEECESFRLPEATLTASMSRAYRMADRLRTSGVRRLSARSLSDCLAIADSLNDAVSDAKCKVDCITLTGDVDTDAATFDSFGNECEDALACISALRLDASRRLTALSDKIDSTHRLDMAKVNAQVDRIVAGLRYNLKRTLSGERTAFDKTVVQKNLQNLSNKAKGGQTLQVLVDWKKAGVDKNKRLFELTLDELQSIIVHTKGGKE